MPPEAQRGQVIVQREGRNTEVQSEVCFMANPVLFAPGRRGCDLDTRTEEGSLCPRAQQHGPFLCLPFILVSFILPPLEQAPQS